MSIPYTDNQRSMLRLRAHAFQRLHTWQRLVVCAALIVDVLIGAALIYFQPGTRTFTQTDMTSRVATTAPVPALPPGTDIYYYWGQHRPLDQQP